MQSHICKVYVCLAVTCHLHLWQNDRDLLRPTAVTRGWSRYQNKSQHRKLTLEENILPPFLQGFKPVTFQSRVRRSNHWAIPCGNSQRQAVTPSYTTKKSGQRHPDNHRLLTCVEIRVMGGAVPDCVVVAHHLRVWDPSAVFMHAQSVFLRCANVLPGHPLLPQLPFPQYCLHLCAEAHKVCGKQVLAFLLWTWMGEVRILPIQWRTQLQFKFMPWTLRLHYLNHT